jgi:hypothetical protein
VVLCFGQIQVGTYFNLESLKGFFRQNYFVGIADFADFGFDGHGYNISYTMPVFNV